MFKTTIISIFLCLGVFSEISSQQIIDKLEIIEKEEIPPNKNAFYISYGNVILESQVSFSYERTIIQQSSGTTRLKFQYGKNLSNNADYDDGAEVLNSNYTLAVSQLVGYFEVNGGISYTAYQEAINISGRSDIKYKILPYFSIGLRVENENFLIRGGLGRHDLLFIGVGFTL